MSWRPLTWLNCRWLEIGGNEGWKTYLHGNLLPKQPTRSPRTDTPSLNVLRVTPNQVTKSALVRNFLRSSHDSDLIQRSDFRGQATVNAQNLAVDDGSQGEKVEYLAARLPDRGVAIFQLTFLVEAVDLGYLAGFVVASDEGYAVRVSIQISGFV
jgi:hypothetical protein